MRPYDRPWPERVLYMLAKAYAQSTALRSSTLMFESFLFPQKILRESMKRMNLERIMKDIPFLFPPPHSSSSSSASQPILFYYI